MRVLWVKAGKLLPVDTGGRIRSFNILRHLASRHATTLLSYYVGERDEEYERRLAAELPGSVALHVPGPNGGLAQVVDYLRRTPSPTPYAVMKFTAPLVGRRIAELLRERESDVAVCDFLSPSANFPRRPAVPTVLFQHNVESALWERQATHESNPAKRAAFTLEWLKMRRYERDAVRRFDHVVAVSEHDRTLMSAMTSPDRITVVPTGVDVVKFGAASSPSEAPVVLFLGSMDWPANSDGVAYFCREIWPRVLSAVPEARFEVVGRNPGPRIAALASDSVRIVGGVESVLPSLQRCRVFVVPLRIGGGTRLKIYEAMAARRAIVSTAVGAEGLDVSPPRDILIEDDAAGFASAVVRLLRDDAERDRVAAAAAATAARFDWRVIAERFAEVLGAVRRPPDAGRPTT
jgi:glycosyltransferase involved in cell wall biosynthesis